MVCNYNSHHAHHIPPVAMLVVAIGHLLPLIALSSWSPCRPITSTLSFSKSFFTSSNGVVLQIQEVLGKNSEPLIGGVRHFNVLVHPPACPDEGRIQLLNVVGATIGAAQLHPRVVVFMRSGEERLIIFTTNHIEKLDPRIRTGRMDKNIEMSYCTYEGFTVLAKNFLNLEDHPKLFEKERVEVTPKDVAERLMPRTRHEKDSRSHCLEKVIEFMKKAKVEKMKKEKDGDPQ
ncbi:AAA-ATPase [Nymphaea thermarum]|nr:AAA-ATPase [Nymphaea thermarum]